MNNINIELRSKILELALNLENNISQLIITCLVIENEERKAISNKSGNLSFKNKIDLLFDLEILNKEEHKLFLLLMEYRNQFLHNIDCNSFEKAFEFLGNDKKNQLIKYLDVESPENYYLAYLNIYGKGIDIILSKHKDIQEKIEFKKDFVKSPLNTISFLVDSIFDLYLTLTENDFVPKDDDSPETIELKNKIFETLNSHKEQTFYSEKYQELSNFAKTTEEDIKKIFK
ncbi:hypothetical protein OF897_10210 [Chryseobacterium formosus]|uniref:DUF4145 domain-containing protein n=1 Tax=Chryseobacterium formosus TaxID=1537363 RepID=A0ABT3XQ95_9FLAO|nr:hypothetical protein [Chryseobacterium formosus]MCX8524283.1 hypothetical protein [Chryseobacterium formosus]